MNDIKTQLIELNNSLDEEDFDLLEFQEKIQEINEHFNNVDIYSSFCNILEVEEATRYDFDEDTMEFINEIQNSPYVDIDNLKELSYDNIVERLDLITNIL